MNTIIRRTDGQTHNGTDRLKSDLSNPFFCVLTKMIKVGERLEGQLCIIQGQHILYKGGGGVQGYTGERCGLFRTGVKPPIEAIGASNGEGGKYKGTIYFARGMCA